MPSNDEIIVKNQLQNTDTVLLAWQIKSNRFCNRSECLVSNTNWKVVTFNWLDMGRWLVESCCIWGKVSVWTYTCHSVFHIVPPPHRMTKSHSHELHLLVYSVSSSWCSWMVHGFLELLMGNKIVEAISECL